MKFQGSVEMSKEYTIKQDYLNNVYFCYINGLAVTFKSLGDLLLYIGKLHSYTPTQVFPNLKFILLLEALLNIEINLDF